jgi:hypothetical protein
VQQNLADKQHQQPDPYQQPTMVFDEVNALAKDTERRESRHKCLSILSTEMVLSTARSLFSLPCTQMICV